MSNIKFADLPLSDEVQKAIQDMGFEEATPIQSEAIPILLDNVDIIGQAQTGTGKTAAFGIPTVEKIDETLKKVQAIVLCPTRELAMQVSSELKKLIKYIDGLFTVTVYGGTSIETQIKALKKGVQIIVGTPGRTIDLINRKALDLSHVGAVILDEADEMMNMGFREDMEYILSRTPEHRQTIMFSATMPKAILELSKKYMDQPQVVKVEASQLTVKNIEQFYFEIRERDKVNLMIRLIDFYNLKLMTVFCNTKRTVDALTDLLQQKGLKSDGLHGDLNQNQRDTVMRKFRKNQINLLIATDVAARGIDVDDVDAVFNFDIPLDEEAYVHRIGRTGRAGRQGKAFNFVSGRRDMVKLQDIIRYTKGDIQKGLIPNAEDLEVVKQNKTINEVRTLINDADLSAFKGLTQQLLDQENIDADEIIAALLCLSQGQDKVYPDIENYKFKDKKDKGNQRSKKNSMRDRGRNKRSKKNFRSSGNMTRLFFNVGKKQKVSPGDILGAIIGETGVKSGQIGEIDIYDKYTFVDVENSIAAKVIKVMKKNRIKGYKINVEVAS